MKFVVGRGTKCCGSMPRCRTCPARFAEEIRDLAGAKATVPPHLAGLPECLHKYEPLLRERDAERPVELPIGS